MPPLRPRAARLALLLAALALASGATAARALEDHGPRNRAAEAATGNTDAMRSVVQEVVDCLRARGFQPGDPQVDGENVVIAGWNPAWGTAAARATEQCSFPDR